MRKAILILCIIVPALCILTDTRSREKHLAVKALENRCLITGGVFDVHTGMDGVFEAFIQPLTYSLWHMFLPWEFFSHARIRAITLDDTMPVSLSLRHFSYDNEERPVFVENRPLWARLWNRIASGGLPSSTTQADLHRSDTVVLVVQSTSASSAPIRIYCSFRYNYVDMFIIFSACAIIAFSGFAMHYRPCRVVGAAAVGTILGLLFPIALILYRNLGSIKFLPFSGFMAIFAVSLLDYLPTHYIFIYFCIASIAGVYFLGSKEEYRLLISLTLTCTAASCILYFGSRSTVMNGILLAFPLLFRLLLDYGIIYTLYLKIVISYRLRFPGPRTYVSKQQMRRESERLTEIEMEKLKQHYIDHPRWRFDPRVSNDMKRRIEKFVYTGDYVQIDPKYMEDFEVEDSDSEEYTSTSYSEEYTSTSYSE